MQLVLFIGFSGIVALVFRHRIVVLIGIALSLRVFIPSVAAVAVTGVSNEGQIQPASYFLMITFIVSLGTCGAAMAQEVKRHRWLYLIFASVFFSSLVVTGSLRPPVSTAVLIDTLGCGILLCLLVRTAITKDEKNGTRIAHVFLALAASQGAIAILQRATQSTIFWTDYMSSYYWWSPTVTRATGTVGAWLDLAALLAIAIPLAATIRRVWLRLVVVALLVVGIVLAQGRTSLFVAAVCIVVLVFTSKMKMGARLLSVATVGAGTWALVSSEIFAEITERFQSDDLSTVARTQAADYALSHLLEQPWYGSGFQSSGLTRAFGLLSSFENGYLMYFWDVGIPLSIALFLAMASPLFVSARRRLVAGSGTCLAAAMFLIASFSGFQTPGPMSWMVFLAVGLAASRLGTTVRHIETATVERPARPSETADFPLPRLRL